MDWFYIDKDGDPQGPLTIQEIIHVNNGIGDYFVYREGFPDWKRASELLEFLQPPSAIPPVIPTPTEVVGLNVVPHGVSASESPATERQKAMLIRYGIETQGLTKSKASELISYCQDTGVLVTSENEAKADKAFRKLDQERERQELQVIVDAITRTSKKLGKKKLTVVEVEAIKLTLNEKLSELMEICDNKRMNLEDEEFLGEGSLEDGV
jgi:GYF domain 2